MMDKSQDPQSNSSQQENVQPVTSQFDVEEGQNEDTENGNAKEGNDMD